MNYAQMKKDELIKVLKQRDAAIAGFEETNKVLVKENDDLVCKIHRLERDCEGLNQQCEALDNKNNGLSDDVKRYKTMYDNITIDNNAIKTKYESASNNFIKAVNDITKLKKQKTILTIALSISIIVMIIAIIF